MYIAIAVMVVQTLVTSSLTAGVLALVVGGALAAFFYLVMHRPYILMSDEEILIVNPLSTHRFNWLDVESIDSKFTMSVTVDGKTINAWAAPAPSRYAARKVHPADIKGFEIEIAGSIAHGDSPRSDSGVASFIARQKWNAARQR
jgi:hypothetical protein